MRAWLLPLLLLLAPAVAFSGDWPQFRGPESSGVAPDAAIPSTPKIAWSAALPGRGLSSPIIVGDRVFVTCSSGPKQEQLHVLCFATADGALLWKRQLRATGRTMAHPKTSIAACTPCSDGQHIYALWSSNDLAAFDLEGNLKWLRGLTADYPNASNSLGMASSPAVIGGALVVMIENDSESYSLGIDLSTGRNLWKAERPKVANWTSPLPWRSAPTAAPAVLLQSSKGLVALDPLTGSPLWEYANGASTMSSSVAAGDVVYAVSRGITALRPAGNGQPPTELWQSKGTNPSTISPLVLGEKLFSINGAGVLTAISTATGDSAWKLRLAGPFSASPIGAGQRTAVVNEKGLVQIVDTAGAEGSIVGQLQLPLKSETKELVLGTPSISGKSLYVRTDSTLWKLGE